jgi:hypothetical protein
MIDSKASKKIRAANLANIIRQVKAGRPLSAAHLKLLDEELQRTETAKTEANLPTFDSMATCSARTGIPLSVLKQAKKAGCTAFRMGSRVELEPLLRFLFSQSAEEAGLDWSNELKKWQAKRQQQAYEQRDRELVDQDEVLEILIPMSARQNDCLVRFENEAPVAMAGVDPGTGRLLAKRYTDDIRNEFKATYASWKDFLKQ